MIIDELIKYLDEKHFSILCGVPDSLLSELTFAFDSIKSDLIHLKSSSEGSAVGQAIGAYLSTEKPALIYMQNSGFGNAINPLTSLASQQVYGIPMVIVIGWRGEVENNTQSLDEEQHLLQGKITIDLLKLLEIDFKIINNIKDFTKYLKIYRDKSLVTQKPVALVIRKKTFKKIKKIPTNFWKSSDIIRKKAIQTILSALGDEVFYVTNTGFTSREFLETKLDTANDKNVKDFLCIGGMGHAISVAAGIAITKDNKKVVCFDGDGSMLMHLGSYRSASQINNMIVFLFNNGCHESVGGNLVDSKNLSFADIAKTIGFKKTYSISNEKNLISTLDKINKINCSLFIEIKCNSVPNKNLARPKFTMQDLKYKILSQLSDYDEKKS